MDCAVLFADVSGSTALYEVLGDERAFALVETCLATMSACTAAAHGRVVKTIGDAVMAVFDSADQAASAAAEMQTRVAEFGPAVGVRLSLRIGLHFGPVVERDGDVFGDTVNLASRLCDLASKGQIVTDGDSARRLSAQHAARLQRLYSIPVKGKEQEVELVVIPWQAPSDDTTRAASLARPDASHTDGASKKVTIKKTDSGGNAVTIVADYGNTIDGAASVALSSQYDFVTLLPTAANWWIVATNF